MMTQWTFMFKKQMGSAQKIRKKNISVFGEFTFFSCVGDFVATSVEVGAFYVGETACEAEDGLAESARQMRRFPVHQFDL